MEVCLSNSDDMNERIEAEAAAWMVQLASGQVTASDLARLGAWRNQSPAHEAAFTFAQQTWQDLEALRGELPFMSLESDAHLRPQSQRQTFFRHGDDRSPLPAGERDRVRGVKRNFLVGFPVPLVFLIAVSLAVYVADPITFLQADYHTGIGEIRQFSLPDGTTAQLNTHSALALHFGERERRVEVLYGEATFTVAREKTRPFVVEAGDVEARALGTRYVVRTDRERIDVTVLRHRVAIARRNSLSEVVGSAGQRVRCDASGPCGPVEAIDTTSATAWQRGKLIFDRAPLSAVVAELGRYRRGFILVADNELATRTVSGVFRLDELDAALDTIIAELDLKAVQLSSLLTLLY